MLAIVTVLHTIGVIPNDLQSGNWQVEVQTYDTLHPIIVDAGSAILGHELSALEDGWKQHGAGAPPGLGLAGYASADGLSMTMGWDYESVKYILNLGQKEPWNTS